MLKQILIDADTGIDDSIAILFALKRPDVRVMGVTTGFGNTTARQAAEIARDARVKRLVIGHYSARYEDLSGLHREAEAVFPGTILGNEGMVITV